MPLRMLGLFLVLPVFALEAHKYPGGDDPALIGLAMGIYGLTQGASADCLLAWPRTGWAASASIVIGLLVFAAGSFWRRPPPVAGLADRGAIVAGRRCAVSAAVTALLADQTRDEVRTKAMALVGASIGLMFALSLVLAPHPVGEVGIAGAVRDHRRAGADRHRQ
jgi:hypothetical protein